VANDIDAVFGDEAGDLVTQEIDEDQTLLEQFTSISLAARSKLEEIDSAIYKCENYLAEVIESEAAFTSTIDYGTRLPGRLIGAITSALNRISGSIYSESLAPSVYLSNLQAAFEAFGALFTNGDYPVSDQVNQEIALRYALETSYVYDRDNAESTVLRSIEDAEPFDILGRHMLEVEPPAIMTMIDLEESLYRARALLQAAVDRDRESAKGFKDLATALLSFVETVRLEREKIISVIINSEMPLFIVCMRNNIPIAYAERILSINDRITNPSFVSGEVKIYAR
jgi:hypothetical protein